MYATLRLLFSIFGGIFVRYSVFFSFLQFNLILNTLVDWSSALSPTILMQSKILHTCIMVALIAGEAGELQIYPNEYRIIERWPTISQYPSI